MKKKEKREKEEWEGKKINKERSKKKKIWEKEEWDERK